MKVFTAAQLREIDAYTITNEPIEPVSLMERAAAQLTGWYIRHFHTDRELVVLAGTGNNGGDALAMARMLAERKFRVSCWLVGEEAKRSQDCRTNLERLKKQGLVPVYTWNPEGEFPGIGPDTVVIDGLFGSGLTRPLSGPITKLVRFLNSSRATIISIDIPSGLATEDNSAADPDHIVQAEYTLTFQFPFLSMFFPENERFVGSWRVLDIGLHREIIRQLDTPYETTGRARVRSLLPRRSRFAHKGSCGHALLIAGSYGMMGAAILAGKAALRSGAGLLSLHVPRLGYGIIQTAVPEALVRVDKNDEYFTGFGTLDAYTAVAAGPGLGTSPESAKALHRLIGEVVVPLVLDADALNILAQNKDWIGRLPAETILTPHPREFERLTGFRGNSYDRLQAAMKFAVASNVIIVLKGAWTCIVLPDGRCLISTTGNPGMATGGTGDVLTGIIVSLLAQGLKPADAAVAGTFLHGLAGDLAAEKMGVFSMLAGDLPELIGEAWKKIMEKPEERKGFRGGVLSISE